MFNSVAFNERMFNYSPINYITATLELTCNIGCTPSTRLKTSATIDCTSDMSCDTLRRCFASPTFDLNCTLDVILRAYINAFGKGIKIEADEVLTMPTKNTLFPKEGTVQCIIYPLRDYGETEQFIFDANGSENQNLQVLIKTNGRLALRYGTGLETLEIIGDTVLQKEMPYRIAWGWSETGVKLFLNGELIASNFTPPDFSFGAFAYIGSNAGIKQLDGIMDDFCVTAYMKSDDEIEQDSKLITPLEVIEETTYKLDFDDTLETKASHVWVSPPIDVSNATDKTSGHCSISSETPGESIINIQSRSAPAVEGPWSDWANAAANGNLQHDPDNIIQIRIIMTRNGYNPSLSSITVSFDGSPSVELLADNFASEAQFYFTTFMDDCIIVNGLEAPRKYDGSTLEVIGDNPPHSLYVENHKNRLWFVRGSRLYFSDLLNVDSWPVLNFIDISPNDGDYITGIKQVGDYLVITKQHSTWLLSGEGVNTFAVRRVHPNKGAYASRSLTMVNDTLCFVSDDGVYFSDLVQTVIISERLRTFWRTLNSRRFDQAVCWHTDHKLYIAVPSANSLINDRVIVYDTLRQCFVGIIPNWNISCFTEFREGGKRISLFGHSDKGQVSQIDVGYSDNGAPIPFKWKSREMDFGASEVLKRWNQIFADIVPANKDVTLRVTFFVDGVAKGPIPVTVPGDTTGLIHNIRALASRAGVIDGRRLAIQIEQEVLDNPISIHRLSVEYMIGGLKPSVYA